MKPWLKKLLIILGAAIFLLALFVGGFAGLPLTLHFFGKYKIQRSRFWIPALLLACALLFGIGAVLILAVMAMVFRNLHLIFRNSENATPFQLENIRRMKEIGVFSIAVPVVGFIMSVLIRLIIGVENAEIRIDLGGIFMGVIVFCLTQYFAHGAKLEQDVDGLL